MGLNATPKGTLYYQLFCFWEPKLDVTLFTTQMDFPDIVVAQTAQKEMLITMYYIRIYLQI